MRADSGIVISAATAADLPAVEALLQAAGLPHEDIRLHESGLLVARVGAEIVATVAAQRHGSHALLRSLAVAPAFRGQRLGIAMVRRLDCEAAGWGVQRWWLLTTTAAEFFQHLGFERVGRETAPPDIASTTQFRGLCPSTAVCMSKLRPVP